MLSSSSSLWAPSSMRTGYFTPHLLLHFLFSTSLVKSRSSIYVFNKGRYFTSEAFFPHLCEGLMFVEPLLCVRHRVFFNVDHFVFILTPVIRGEYCFETERRDTSQRHTANKQKSSEIVRLKLEILTNMFSCLLPIQKEGGKLLSSWAC